jgi:hypothetical protein
MNKHCADNCNRNHTPVLSEKVSLVIVYQGVLKTGSDTNQHIDFLLR